MNYVTPKEAARQLGVSISSLRRWENEGKVKAIKTPGNQRRFDLDDILKLKGEKQIKIIAYARVSTASQRDDLQRQISFLSERYPNAELISEIGSGLNFRRRKFLAILDRVFERDCQTLVVAHQDRLCRFGFKLIEYICQRFECELVVLKQTTLSPEQELVQDILSILHCFSSRLYGLRKYESKVKKDLQNSQAQINKTDTKLSTEN